MCVGRFCGVCRGCVCFEVCVGFMGCCVCGMRLYVYGVCGMSVCVCVWYVYVPCVCVWYVCVCVVCVCMGWALCVVYGAWCVFL